MLGGTHITNPEPLVSKPVAALSAGSATRKDAGLAAPVPNTVLMQEGGVEGEGLAGATREHGGGEPSQPPLPSGRVENKPDGPAVTAAELHSIPDAQQQKEHSPPPASDGSEEYPGLAVTNSHTTRTAFAGRGATRKIGREPEGLGRSKITHAS